VRAEWAVAAAIGLILGLVFGGVQVSVPAGFSQEMLVVAYAMILILVTMALLSSIRYGLFAGLAAMICLSATEFFYDSFVYGTAIAAGIFPYSALFLPRIVVLPVSGVFGALMGGEVISPRSRKKRTAGKSVKAKSHERKRI
jgi:hypothetical protein